MENDIFEVIVSSTMSAGKSTLLNAIIGKELLPSKNEACTARVCRIEDDDSKNSFFIRKTMQNGNIILEQCDSEKLFHMNNEHHTSSFIDIVGDIPSIINMDKRLVIYDTPGPNNSCDITHYEITKSILHDGNYGLILYIINATQIGINDDHQLLTEIKSVISNSTEHKDVLFIVNKIDEIDDEKESISTVLKNVQIYLENNGFNNPIILPVSAYYALLARKVLNGDKLTRVEQISLYYQLQDFEENHFKFINLAYLPSVLRQYSKTQIKKTKSATITDSFEINKSVISNNILESFIHYTGIGLLEHVIQELLIINIPTLDDAVLSLNKIFGTYFSNVTKG